MASSQSQASMASDVYVQENIDFDETEQSLIEVQTLKKHISIFEEKITKSQKIFDKRNEEQDKTLAQVEGAKIFEQDIYELDFIHNSLTDFLNNLEITLHKLGYLE